MPEEAENPNAGIWQQILSESTTAEGVSIDGRSVIILGWLMDSSLQLTEYSSTNPKKRKQEKETVVKHHSYQN